MPGVGCCSDAGYASIQFYVVHQLFWGAPSYDWRVIQTYWWGGGNPGVNWGIVLPYGSQGYFAHLDGGTYQDGGWGASLYNWYDWGRGPYSGFLWWPVRIIHECVIGVGCGGGFYPTFHIFVHQDGWWYVHRWSE